MVIKKVWEIAFLLSWLYSNLMISFDIVDECKARLQAERIDFVSVDIDNVALLQAMIFCMCELDQACRVAYIHDRKNEHLKSVMLEIDALHTDIMKKIIARYGWLIISRFGKETDQQAFLLVQHARDVDFQAACLDLLEQALDNEETHPRHYAYLYDRVALQQEKYNYQQKYGTQFYLTEQGDFILLPYQGSLEDVDRRRLSIGLSSLAEYSNRFISLYQK